MPSVSAAQHRAMEAAAHGRSTLGIPQKVGKEFVAADAGMPIAAGIVFVAPDGEVLLLRRAGIEGVDNFVGHWALPGGKAEAGETPEDAATREAAEELGNMAPDGPKKLLDRRQTPNGMIYSTFVQPVQDKFWPVLNEEHSGAGWFSIDKLPAPLHPAVGDVLGANLGIAEDMAPEDWALRDNFAKWTREDEAEPEHNNPGPRHHHDLTPADDYAEDNQPALATTANTGMPALAKISGRLNRLAKRRGEIARDAMCSCGGKGCKKCGGSGVAPVWKVISKGLGVTKAYDMAGFMRRLARDGWNEGEHPRKDDGKFGSGSGAGSSSKTSAASSKASPKQSAGSKSSESTSSKPALKMADLSKKGGKLGSNEGGLYEDKGGAKFYIKKPGSKAHVQNERTAAALYQLAGAKTLDYRDVEGGEHVASEWKQLEKKNISEFTPAERKEAAKDFAIHAWLSNWDAAGTGGDNQGVLGGKTTTLDVGGSLRFRAQGGPKGNAFGDKVIEWDTMRDKGMSPDAARLFAPMTEAELKSSVERVTAIPDAKIREIAGSDKELGDRLIARKKDLAKKVGLAMDSSISALFSLSRQIGARKNQQGPDAVKAAIAMLAQDSRAEPEHTLTVRYDGDFSFKGLLAHLQRLGSIGASRTIEARDEDDKIVPFGWDGDGADKIWDAEIDGETLAFDRVMVMGLVRPGLAFDRAVESVRSIDADGRMHVEVSNISKATVNPYLGKEIPKYKDLGLDPDRVYQLLRDPEELQKAAPTFNNLPLLDEHVGVNAADHKPQHVIGSTGTDSAFEHPHLKNSLVVWANRGIKAIESKKKKELSSAYRYRADMTPGDYEGVRYDGVMRDIVGNHVALVEEGRAGSDVVVGDSSNPLTKPRNFIMSKKALLSRCATVAHGALMVYLTPQLAMDAKIDLKTPLRGITAANFKEKRSGLRSSLIKMVAPHLEDPALAQDGSIKMGLDAVLDMVDKAKDDFPDDLKKKDDEKAEDDDMDDDAEDEDDEEAKKKAAEEAAKKKAADKKAKDAKRAKDAAAAKAKDEKDVNEEDEEHDPDDENAEDETKEETERAMDEKIQAGISAGIKKERDRLDAISVAKEHVRGRVGALSMAFDSAAGVYSKAIEMASGKKPPKEANVEMLKFAFDALPAKDGNNKRTYAMDSAPSQSAQGDIAKRTPKLAENMARIGRQ